MSIINLSDLSVDNSGNTPLIIKNGKIQCANEEIQSIYIYETIPKAANFTSSQIISMINAGYLPYISLENGLGLFKYYYYNKDGYPCVLFDLVNGREQQQEATVSKSNNTRGLQTNTIPEDFIEYLNCAMIDWDGNVYYPNDSVPLVEK